ncbi:hypothetical protein [Bdellovibrio sp. HCB288]|uniref:hypothetical protein n=1 Tax=Bdellovibrio sp. HCB288 TaxID=3394355 RepID=UPI0039B44338
MKFKGFATVLLLVLATSSAFAAPSHVWFSRDGQCHEISSDGDDLGVVSSQLCGGNIYQWLSDGNCHIWTGGDTDGGIVSDQMCGGTIYQRLGSDDACHKMSRGGADRGVVAESYCGG